MENSKGKIFKPYLAFYWQSIAVFAVILIIWSAMKGSLDKGEFYMILEDSLVLLLLFFILFSLISLSFHLLLNRTIIIDNDSITFGTRFGEKKISLDNIIYIKLGRERLFQFREKLRVIKVKVKGRRFHITIRPSAYEDEQELFDLLLNQK